jgi:hypothetical protein
MLSGLLARLGRVRVTVIYAAALTVVAVTLLRLGPQVHNSVIQYASTNLHNLRDGRVVTLIDSAFVNQPGPIYFWLPGLVALLALGELVWKSRRLVVAFVVGHVGATLVVAAALAAALAAGRASNSIADAADVGMSYGAVGVLGTLTAALPGRWADAWAGWWLAVAVSAVALSGGDFTSAGHAVALVFGMLLGTLFGPAEPWTVPRSGLLAVAAAFSYLLLAYGEMSIQTTAFFGALGALTALCLAGLIASGQTNSSAQASIQSDNQLSGGSSSSSPGINHS